ncbi:MAG: hypothetical protein RMK18_03165 [Armatimonadota bacterium]|nr:hypothetical protein [Armatimonadota bacterium]MCX7778138.1 hypothetical protein [Armatimonadota bacterium]MDW8024850.1 hypothetical protein [Armatimonadota bacterium]
MAFIRWCRGETQLTYALILVLIAVAAIVAVALFGEAVEGLFSTIYSKVSAVFPSAPTTVEQGESEMVGSEVEESETADSEMEESETGGSKSAGKGGAPRTTPAKRKPKAPKR